MPIQNYKLIGKYGQFNYQTLDFTDFLQPPPPKEKKGKDLQCPYKIIKLICNNGKYTSKF